MSSFQALDDPDYCEASVGEAERSEALGRDSKLVPPDPFKV